MTLWRRSVLPSGMVLSLLMPEPEVSYSLPPMQFIPVRSAERIAAEERRESARKALAILRDHVPPVHALPGSPCATCVFRSAQRRLLPFGFPLPPFDFTPIEYTKRDIYGADAFAPFAAALHMLRLSSVIKL